MILCYCVLNDRIRIIRIIRGIIRKKHDASSSSSITVGGETNALASSKSAAKTGSTLPNRFRCSKCGKFETCSFIIIIMNNLGLVKCFCFVLFIILNMLIFKK